MTEPIWSVTGRQLADRAEQAERRADGRHAEQQRQPGGDERAEGDEQDQQRERQRQRLGLLEVLAERLLERLLAGGRADLLDAQVRGARPGRPRWPRASRRRARAASSSSPAISNDSSAERPSSETWPVAPASNAETTFSTCGTVLRRSASSAAACCSSACEARARTSLQEHLLAAGLAKAGLVDREVGGPRRAVAHLGWSERVRPDQPAADRRGDDEREPSEDRDPAVLRAPAACSCCDVRRSHGGSPSSW